MAPFSEKNNSLGAHFISSAPSADNPSYAGETIDNSREESSGVVLICLRRHDEYNQMHPRLSVNCNDLQHAQTIHTLRSNIRNDILLHSLLTANADSERSAAY